MDAQNHTIMEITDDMSLHRTIDIFIPIGGHFKYKDVICEVVRWDNSDTCNVKPCSICHANATRLCATLRCTSRLRVDNTEVVFRKVEN